MGVSPIFFSFLLYEKMPFVPKLKKIFQICLISLKGNGLSYILCNFYQNIFIIRFLMMKWIFYVPKNGQLSITIVLKLIVKITKFSYILAVYDLNFHFISYFCHIFNLDPKKTFFKKIMTLCAVVVFLDVFLKNSWLYLFSV